MGFNRDVIRRRRDQLDAMGVRVRWAGRRPRLWRSVISELEDAEQRTVGNDVLTLQFCVNYGGRAEIVDAARRIAELAAAGRLDPAKLTEDRFRQFLDEPEIPDVDLFVRSSGEQRTSNFLLWQSAYAEMVFLDRLWPDFDRRDLWRAIELTRIGTGATAAPCPTRRPDPAVAARSHEHSRRPVGVATALRRARTRLASTASSGRGDRSAAVAGAEDLQVVADVAEAVLLRPPRWPTSPPPGRTPRRSGRSCGRPDGGGARSSSAGRPSRRRRCAARPARRLRSSPAGCGRPWSARPARRAGAARRGSACAVRKSSRLGQDRVDRRPLAGPLRARRSAAGRCRDRPSVLVVVVGVGGVPVSLVQEVGVVAVLDRDVAAARSVPVRVALGDQVRR